MNDDQKRAKIWKEEGRVIACDRHIIGFEGIKRVYDIRFKIKCGQRGCPKNGAYELEMTF